MVEIKKLTRIKKIPPKLKKFDGYIARSGFEQQRLEKKIKDKARRLNKRVIYRKSTGTNKFDYYINK